MQPEAPGVPGGTEAVNTAEPLGLEVVVALELLAQPPELPVTPDWIFTLCVLDVLLHVYAIVVLGVLVIRNVAATKMIHICYYALDYKCSPLCSTKILLYNLIVYGLRPPQK